MDRPKFTTASFLRILGLRTGKTQAVSHPVQTNPTAMNRGSSFVKSSRKDSQKSEEKCKAFKDICKYFSKEEWAKLGNSQKCTYVYMKRNYDTMTGLGNRKTQTLKTNVWAYRLRERKNIVMYEEISDLEEDD
ncbi:protein SSX1-like [Pteropus medius]|uniref:protein SSX1-like n=1 Tax=Pteropus vampyrus TaxID=132908 RepID=UPI00196B49EF|nr:protein SSX1-like [Pteropus giganteus]